MLMIKSIHGPVIGGEGDITGVPCIVITFAGCNMWDGNIETKKESACSYCDVDFSKKGATWLSPIDVLRQVNILSATDEGKHGKFLIVFTGGEPLLQKTGALLELIQLLKSDTYKIAIETNGTIAKNKVLTLVDNVTCSPALPPEQLSISWSNVTTLKVAYPHPNSAITPEAFDVWLKVNEIYHLNKFVLVIDQPPHTTDNLNTSMVKVKQLGLSWRLSIQLQKVLGE